MSYNDLTTVKKINGVPADLTFYEKLGENDSIFKSATDADEDLSELDRDIFPTTDNMFDIGEPSKAFKSIYSHNLLASYMNLYAGLIGAPSLVIGTAGLTSLNNNELSFIGTPGLESIKMMTSGLLIKAANNSQLKIQNTLPGSESLWHIGCDENGFKIGDSVVIKDVSTDILNTLKLQMGTIAAPSLTFVGDATTGISKDITNPILNFTLSGVNKLALSSAALEVMSSQLILPLSRIPSLSFAGFLETGIGSVDGSQLDLTINNKKLHSFKESGYESRLESASLFDYRMASDTQNSKFEYSRSKGTLALPSAIVNQSTIYEATFKGHNGSDYVSGAELIVQSEEDFDSTFGTAFYLRTCAIGESSIENRLAVGERDRADVHISTAFGVETLKWTVAGTNQVLNVRHASKIMVDATSGTIEIAGFSNGQEGQILHIYKKTTNNTFRLLFNGAAAPQKVLLKDSTDFTITNNYGGIILSYDDGVWREISRS